MHPKNISIQDYTYYLPDEKIPPYPLPERDASKLLIYNKTQQSARSGTEGDDPRLNPARPRVQVRTGMTLSDGDNVGQADRQGLLIEDIYKNIDTHLPGNSLLVFNDTRVIEARLLFQKSTGGIIEIFCLEPDERYPDIASAMMQQGRVFWKCLVGGASKWKRGLVLEKKSIISNYEIRLEARYIEKRKDHFIIELSWSLPTMSFAEILHHTGAIPLPPYIKREPDAGDSERYQTVYALHEGSVAAPTAGLHFTKTIFKKLEKKNIQTSFVTLHVGAGTFKPVKSETMEQHEMHAEFIDVSQETIEQICGNLNNSIIAAGTTSLRTIETLYWLGVKIETRSRKLEAENPGTLPELDQWEAYELAEYNIAPANALLSLVNWMRKNEYKRLQTKTKIIIAPGYIPKIVNGLITNFHQPRSTLLLLVAALIGDDWRKVYDYALQNEFRFLSYGDGCLLLF